MGDGDSLKLFSAYDSAPLANGNAGRTSYKITYSAKGNEGWAGIYWLTPANNWGTMKGAGFDFSGATRVTFWIRGDQGGELISEIVIGGIASGTYPDSDRASIGPLRLSTKWQQYAIDLQGKDLRHIIGGFAFALKRADNVNGAKFYLDEIVFEGASVSTAPLVAAVPERVIVSTPMAEAPVVAAATHTYIMPVPAVSTEPVKKIIAFDSSQKRFGNEAVAALADILKAAESASAKVSVDGHTDSVGDAGANLKLSQLRAQAVADYLIANGLDSRKISVRGWGESKPIMPENTRFPDVARRTNRRVEVTVKPGTAK
jgi:outer membrane protein OmpA-like peptidoglycan-associated protein